MFTAGRRSAIAQKCVVRLEFVKIAENRRNQQGNLGDYRKYLLGIRRFRKMYWTVARSETILLAKIASERDSCFARCEIGTNLKEPETKIVEGGKLSLSV